MVQTQLWAGAFRQAFQLFWVWSTLASLCPISSNQTQQRQNKIMGMPRIKTGAFGWEARMQFSPWHRTFSSPKLGQTFWRQEREIFSDEKMRKEVNCVSLHNLWDDLGPRNSGQNLFIQGKNTNCIVSGKLRVQFSLVLFVFNAFNSRVCALSFLKCYPSFCLVLF